MRLLLWTRLIALVLASPCQGAVLLYDNGVTATNNWIVSDNSPGADQLVADDFSLASNAAITSIQWRGVYGRAIIPDSDNFFILISADNGGAPATIALYTFEPAVTRSPQTPDLVFTYVADITPTTLVPGVTYWLSIFEELPVDLRWAWLEQEGGNLYYRANLSQPYTISIPLRTDFQLFGTPVPEPGSTFLLLAGLGLLGFVARRHKI